MTGARRRPRASDEEALQRMKRQKRRDTKPEILVRRMLREQGHFYRIENSDLPGSPDIANRAKGWAIFVHGCYWHAHEGCPRATVPRRNREFWLAKFEANRERDRRVSEALEEMGFLVLTVWECETMNTALLRKKIEFIQALPAI